MEILLVTMAAMFIAFFNGSNDNIKGVATLYGSGVTDYKKTILWRTITTSIGSLFVLVNAKVLIMNFSGKGLVPINLFILFLSILRLPLQPEQLYLVDLSFSFYLI